MPQSTGSIYEIRWHELCPWLVLVKALRASLFFRVLLFAWIGMLATQWGWSVCENVADRPSAKLKHLTQSDRSRNPEIMDIRELKASERRLMASSLFQVDRPRDEIDSIKIRAPQIELSNWLTNHWQRHGIGTLYDGWSWLSSPFLDIFNRRASPLSVVQHLLCGLWAIAVWGIAGGAIARITARYLTREETIGPVVAIQAAASKWPSTTGAPIIALAFAAFMTVPLAIMGFLIRADFLAMLAGLIWVFYLAWGILLAIVLIALWLGWPLIWATIAVERSDAFDAASRTAAYIYQRPVRLVFYIAVAMVLGMFGQIVVSGFVAAGDYLTDWGVSWGAGIKRTTDLTTWHAANVVTPTLTGSAATAAGAIEFWKSALASVSAAYPLAYLFSASVGIYLLLRLDVDATEMDEIVIETIEQPREMPELAEHEPEDLSTRRDISLEPADD